MRSRRWTSISRRELIRGAALGLAAASSGSPSALAQVRPRAPSIGVNVGYAMRLDDVVSDVAAFERVIGRHVDYVVEHGAQASWKEAVSSAAHALRTWRTISVGSRRKLFWNQPLTVADTPLSAVVAGRHDSSFESIAVQIRNNGFYDAIINLGFDMTGDWVPWAATTGNRLDYIDAYRRVVTIFKKVSPSFKMCWSPSPHAQSVLPEDAYPGDEHVDLVGMSVLLIARANATSLVDQLETTMIGHGATPIEGRRPYALAWLSEFGKAHQKRLVIPELGIGIEVPREAGAELPQASDDDAVLVRMAEWMTQNDVALHCWRDLPNSDWSAMHTRISRSSLISGSIPADPADEKPRLAAAYRKAWGGNS